MGAKKRKNHYEKRIKNLEVLPSGNYRLQKTINGQRITHTFDKMPTEQEIQLVIAEKLQVKVDDVKSYRETLKVLCESYIKSKANVLSPATIREYRRFVNNVIPADLLKTPLSKITQVQIQASVNDYASTHSPKSTANYSSFLCSVLRMFEKDFTITLPDKEEKDPYIPSDEDVRKVLQAVSGTKYEVPYTLACLGMRRSEICALTGDDVEIINEHIAIVHITKALVKDEHNNWVIKPPKTTKSKRDINVPASIASMIIERGFAYKGYPDFLSDHLYEIEDSLGIEHFSIHKLRHYFASKLSESGVSEADILELGGWKTATTMKSIYRHSMKKHNQTAKQEIVDNLLKDIT